MNEYYYEADGSKGYIKAETDRSAIDSKSWARHLIVKRKINGEWKIIHKGKKNGPVQR